MLRQGGRIAGAMQDADDHELIFVVQIIKGIIAGETDAQTCRKILPRGCCKRKMAQRLAIVPDFVDDARRCRL